MDLVEYTSFLTRGCALMAKPLGSSGICRRPRIAGGRRRCHTAETREQKNPHGDLIIWLEALADYNERKAEQLVIITRDTLKDDWVYLPNKIKDEQVGAA